MVMVNPGAFSNSDLGAGWAGNASLNQVFKDAGGVTAVAKAGRCMHLVLKGSVGQAPGER